MNHPAGLERAASAAAPIFIVGSLSVDVKASGLTRFPTSGEHVRAEAFSFAPGGKGYNGSMMLAQLVDDPSSVMPIAHIGTVPPGSFWNVPHELLLKEAGVNTRYVTVDARPISPRVALVYETVTGEHTAAVIPGSSDLLTPADIDAASPLMARSGKTGWLVLTFGCPLKTIHHAATVAKEYGLRLMIDPGSWNTDKDQLDIRSFLNGTYLIKPNEQEAKMLTGITVHDFASARQAAHVLRDMGVQHVFITHAAQGGYLFYDETALHIPAPVVPAGTHPSDVGCGDQTMSALVAALSMGLGLKAAAKRAILAGTLQYQKPGIIPVTRQELAQQRLG
jgi:ribokinase